MGFDLSRDNQTVEELSYYRWNIWGFPPVRFLGEIYGWIPAGTICEAWTDDNGKEYPASECGYDTNDGQTVSAEDAQAWADALKLAIPDLKKMKLVKPEDKSSRIDDSFWAERNEIHDKIPQAIMRWFNTERDIDYL